MSLAAYNQQAYKQPMETCLTTLTMPVLDTPNNKLVVLELNIALGTLSTQMWRANSFHSVLHQLLTIEKQE